MKKFTLALCVLCTVIFSYVKADQKIRTVTFWTFASNNCEELKRRKHEIEQKFNINLQIELMAQNTFVQKLQLVMMDQEGIPDIIEWMIESNRILSKDPEKSFVIPLNRFIAKSTINNNISPGRLSLVTYGGNIYGLPHDAHPIIMVYNDTIWKNADVDVAKIETWDEFFEKAKNLRKLDENGKQKHFALPSSEMGLGDAMYMMWQQTGAQILTKDGRPNLNSYEFKNFVKKWSNWEKSGAMTTWDWGNFQQLIKDGTYASYISPDWWVSQTDAAANEGKYQFNVRSLPLYKRGIKTGSSWGGSFLAIPKGTKDADFIFNIMQYIQYDNSALEARYTETEMLPPVKSFWNNNVLDFQDPRFGGQKIRRLQADSAKILMPITTGDIFWELISIFSDNYRSYTSGKLSFDEMINNSQQDGMETYKSFFENNN
ncbi:MAG TPA: extracellular solute-binding protein [Spirochaetota bacterium]|nr:extracellular solute-binding protein [Spirochaetota bacterium]